jgi:ribosomal-protein-alanine N-acetyltransferase
MRNFKIRNVTLEDLPRISEVNHSAFGSPSHPYSLRQNFDLFSETYYVGILDEQLIGYCLGALKPLSNIGWILDLGLKKEYSGKGLGMEIFRKTCSQMKELGAEEIFLTVAKTKVGLIKKFRENMFIEVRNEDSYFGPGNDRIIMKSTLNISVLSNSGGPNP